MVSRTVPKWEALTSHSGRKTFVSLLLEAGLSTKDLMGITHNDLRALRQYAETGILDATAWAPDAALQLQTEESQTTQPTEATSAVPVSKDSPGNGDGNGESEND